MQPSVAIVILNYNGKNYLQQLLPSVFASSYANKKIIVADNGSIDDSINYLKESFPSVELIILDTNYGFAEGYNQALKQVETDYYVLLNSDVEVTTNWIEPIISLMENDKQIAACQPKILSYHNKEYFEYAGAAGGWIDYLGYPFNRGRIMDVLEKDTHQYDTVQQIFWASGASMFIRAELFHKAGGFDKFFFAHQEEIDLCWRLQLMDYKIMCCPQSLVYHVGGGTLPKGHYRKTFLNFRNNIIMLSKNLSFSEGLWKMPLRILLDAIFAWKSLFTGDAASFKAVFNAHLAWLQWRVYTKQQRQYKRKKLLALSGVSNHSIVWAYFMKKQKRFSSIVKD